MTNSCKDVLNHLRELCENDFRLLTYVSDAPCICLNDDLQKCYDYSNYAGEIGAILGELERTGYVQFDNRGIVFSLTYKGLHPYELAWEEMKTFLFRSVAVPVFVSAITTLITLWLQSL